MTYEPEDAAYDAYVAEHGDPMDGLDDALRGFAPALTVVMRRHDETLEIRVYAEPRVFTFTYPPVGPSGPAAFGFVREVPYGPRDDGAALLLKFINDFEAAEWARIPGGAA